jgi:hypothetical protein
VKTTYELLLCRWRAAQLVLACRDRDSAQAGALVAAMGVEGVDYSDAMAEFDLLAYQFAHRSRWYLAAEVDRVADKLGVAR